MSETDPLFQAAYFIKTVASHVDDATAERDSLLAERDELRAALKEAIDLAKNIPLGGDGWQARHVRLAELQRLVTP
jgi:hypothetical protein